MGTHPTMNPSTGPGAAYTPQTLDTSDSSVAGTVVPFVTPFAPPLDVKSAGQTLNSATTNATISYPINGQGTLGLAVSGLTASGATLTFEISNDGGTTWSPVGSFNAATGVASSTMTTDQQTRIDCGGHTNVRVRVSTVGTGTITIAATASAAVSLTANTSPIVAGSNIIGKVGIDQTTPGISNGVVNTPANGSAISTSQPSVGTTAAVLSAAGSYNRREIVNPPANANPIYIGGSGVTATTGFAIYPGSSSGDLSRFTGALYAICATAQTVALLTF